MTSELLRVALAINQARLIVEKQKSRSSDKNENNYRNKQEELNLQDYDEPRVFYDLPLRLKNVQILQHQREIDELQRQTTSTQKITTRFYHENYTPKIIKNSSISSRQRSEFDDKTDDGKFNGKTFKNEDKKILQNRKIGVTSAFKNMPDITQCLSESTFELDKLIQRLTRRNRQDLVKPKIKVKSQIKMGKLEYKIGSRSMSNLPVKKLDSLIEQKNKNLIDIDKHKHIRERSYDLEKIHEYIKKKKIEAKKNKREAEVRVERLKYYDSDEIKKFMKKQQEKRKLNKKDEDVSFKCNKKSYDQEAVKEYMMMKKKEKKEIQETKITKEHKEQSPEMKKKKSPIKSPNSLSFSSSYIL